LLVLLALTGAAADAADPKDKPDPQDKPDSPFVPTPQIIVEEMLKLADVKKDDVLIDLGCGDGRFLVTAAKKYGVKAYGCDLDPERVKESLENAKKSEVDKLVTVELKDMYRVDLSGATVVTLYCLPGQLEKLKPQFAKMKPGARLVAHDFEIPEAKPQKTVKVKNPEGREHTVFLYVTPLQKE
jgi:precorrin-6B methylase 2